MGTWSSETSTCSWIVCRQTCSVSPEMESSVLLQREEMVLWADRQREARFTSAQIDLREVGLKVGCFLFAPGVSEG